MAIFSPSVFMTSTAVFDVLLFSAEAARDGDGQDSTSDDNERLQRGGGQRRYVSANRSCVTASNELVALALGGRVPQ
ncbi:hypothetical protein [Amycolatopsis kentuckyensis]|uniref:hypothetical protein n=1 Tax=Amycolatopsis kentuckyensis TaxID=218823 RepID=UPI0011787B3E|nr:hypothetical protein [Amycolatopsis kentuckyensis]